MCTWTLNGWAIQLFCAQISFFWSAEAPIAQLCKRKDHLVPKCQSQNSNVQAQPDATVWQTKHLFVSKWFHFTLGHIVDFSKGESFRNCFNQELWFRNIFEHQIADSKTCNSQEFPNTSVWRWTLRCSPVSWASETSTDSLEHVLAEKHKRQDAPKLRISIQSCRRNTNNQISTAIKQWRVFWSKRNHRNWCFVWLSIEQLHAVASVACQEKIHRHCGLETLVATNSIAEATCDPSGIWRYFFCKSPKKSKGHNIFKVLFWWWMFFCIKRSWKKLSGLFRSIPCVCWAHIGLLCILESVKLHSSHLWLTFYFDPSPRGSGIHLTFQTQVGVNQVAVYQVTWQGELNMKKFSHPKWSDVSFSSHFRI